MTKANAGTMSGAKMIVKALKDQGVEVVFGYPGGAVLPIYDELFLQNDIRHILVRHEQGAIHMAEGYARSTGKPGAPFADPCRDVPERPRRGRVQALRREEPQRFQSRAGQNALRDVQGEFWIRRRGTR